MQDASLNRDDIGVAYGQGMVDLDDIHRVGTLIGRSHAHSHCIIVQMAVMRDASVRSLCRVCWPIRPPD
jgi:hypothetical protein